MPQKRKKPPKKKHLTEEEKLLYRRLINALRPLPSRRGLSDLELLKEFVVYETDEDESCSSECVCGKTGIRYCLPIIKSIMLKINA